MVTIMLIILKGICLANEILAWRTEIDITFLSMLIHHITFVSHIKCVRWQCQWRGAVIKQLRQSFFFVCLTSLYRLAVGRQSYFCTWSYSMAHTHSLGRNPLNEGSDRHSNLSLKTHNAHKRRTPLAPPPSWNRTPNPSKRAALDPRLRPRGKWYRRLWPFRIVFLALL